MRYIALPINAKTVDADHVSRFNFEVSLSDARPLYFCDTDGTRAGVMWYIRRVTVDKVGEIVARRDAEEIGLTDTASSGSPPTPTSRRSKPAARPGPAAPVDVPAAKPTPAPAPVSPKAPVGRPTRPRTPPPPRAPGRRPEDSADAGRDVRDPAAWKSVAAVVVTGLGVPLAYVGRSLPSGVDQRSPGPVCRGPGGHRDRFPARSGV